MHSDAEYKHGKFIGSLACRQISGVKKRKCPLAHIVFWQTVPFGISIRQAAEASCRSFLPAAGYRGNSSLNNDGSYGNYWSSSLNTNNPNNARNCNFNSSNVNTDNNNNRYNGQSVRPVRRSTYPNAN